MDNMCYIFIKESLGTQDKKQFLKMQKNFSTTSCVENIGDNSDKSATWTIELGIMLMVGL